MRKVIVWTPFIFYWINVNLLRWCLRLRRRSYFRNFQANRLYSIHLRLGIVFLRIFQIRLCLSRILLWFCIDNLGCLFLKLFLHFLRLVLNFQDLCSRCLDSAKVYLRRYDCGFLWMGNRPENSTEFLVLLSFEMDNEMVFPYSNGLGITKFPLSKLFVVIRWAIVWMLFNSPH